MLNISKTIYTGWGSPRQGDLPEAEVIPYGEATNEKKKLDRLTSKNTVVKEHDNIPLPGFTLFKSNRKNWGSLDTTWLVIDPRGFLVRITSENLEKILHVTGVTEGLIQEKCVWARENSETKLMLVPVSANNYTEVLENTELIEGKVDMKDVQIGDTVLLQNKMTGIYKGIVSLYGDLNDYSYSNEYRPTTYLRRQVIEVSSGHYYYQTDLKILKVTDKTLSPTTREESVAIMNKHIESGTADFSNIAHSTASPFSNMLKLASTHAIQKVPMTLEEITLEEAKILFDEALKAADFGMLMLENTRKENFLIDFPYKYKVTNQVTENSFDVAAISECVLNKTGQPEKIVLKSRRRSHWANTPAPGPQRLDNFKKFYKIVKHIKTTNYI